jgi:antirestriction protein ArdC
MNTTVSIPHNPTTGKEYAGKNALLLVCAAADREFPTDAWAGYDQWLGSGRQVRKGETSTHIMRVLVFDDGKKAPKGLRVFNIAQTDPVVA